MTTPHIDSVRGCRSALLRAHEELATFRDDALTALAFNRAGAAIVLDEVRRLRGELISHLRDLCVSLHDERLLLRPQFEALISFAAHNRISTNEIVSRITIDDGRVTSANFNDCGLTSLQGLDSLWSLKLLYVSRNPSLTSLAGIPSMIEELGATACGLQGDLSDLAHVKALKRLYIFENDGIRSLRGLPLNMIEEIYASSCGLRGDLSDIAGAEQLHTLHILRNKGIRSLEGLPLRNMKRIHADYCGLTGDHTFLSGAQNLEVLILTDNPATLTLDPSRFSSTTRLFL